MLGSCECAGFCAYWISGTDEEREVFFSKDWSEGMCRAAGVEYASWRTAVGKRGGGTGGERGLSEYSNGIPGQVYHNAASYPFLGRLVLPRFPWVGEATPQREKLTASTHVSSYPSFAARHHPTFPASPLV